jgi:hypothetical protein
MKGGKYVQFVRQATRGQGVVWVRQVEHWVLRLVSLGFSLASAHAIRWFFAPLDGVDQLQPAITWTVAIGFGILGYCVSRGLAHRLMNKESIKAYAPICLVVELVEMFCNYALAAAVIQRATWLAAVPSAQRLVLTALTYVVLSIIPLVSLLLAVVDMDLERSKHGSGAAGGKAPVFAPSFAEKPQPKEASYAPGNRVPANGAVAPPYAQGYGAVPVTSVPSVPPNGTRMGGAGVPFGMGQPAPPQTR